MKTAVVFWDVAPCGSCLNRRFGGTYRLHLQGRKIRELSCSSIAKFQDYLSFVRFLDVCSTEEFYGQTFVASETLYLLRRSTSSD
jgi:hypothetical protein